MAQPGLRLSCFERHNYCPGIQELPARSDFQKTARTIRARIDSETPRDCSSLQSASTKRADCAAGRSYFASENAVGRDRLFRSENECDFGARLAERTNRRA